MKTPFIIFSLKEMNAMEKLKLFFGLLIGCLQSKIIFGHIENYDNSSFFYEIFWKFLRDELMFFIIIFICLFICLFFWVVYEIGKIMKTILPPFNAEPEYIIGF